MRVATGRDDLHRFDTRRHARLPLVSFGILDGLTIINSDDNSIHIGSHKDSQIQSFCDAPDATQD
jgi:hypothetical protein